MQNNIVYKYKLPRSLWPTFYTPVDIFFKIENVATVQVSDLWALGPLVIRAFHVYLAQVKQSTIGLSQILCLRFAFKICI